MWYNSGMMKKSPGKSKAKAKARTKAAAKKPAPLVVARLEMTDEVRAMFADIMKRMDETAARTDETIKRMDETSARMDKTGARTDKTGARTDATIKRVDAAIKRMDAMHSDHEGLKKSIGLMAESVFVHNFAELMTQIGIPLKDSDIRANLRRDNNSPEYDIVGVNGDSTVAAEVKFRVRLDDVLLLHAKLQKFRGVFPEHSRARLVGVIAGLSLDQGALNAAREYGFIVLKMDGATLSNQTPKGFRPKSY